MDEKKVIRLEQAKAVMPLIGGLLGTYDELEFFL